MVRQNQEKTDKQQVINLIENYELGILLFRYIDLQSFFNLEIFNIIDKNERISFYDNVDHTIIVCGLSWRESF